MGEGDCLTWPGYAYAMPQNFEGAVVVKHFAGAFEQGRFNCRAIILAQGVPGVGLGGLNPCHEVGGKQGELAVVAGCVALLIEPAMGTEMAANFLLQLDFPVQVHEYPRLPFVYGQIARTLLVYDYCE